MLKLKDLEVGQAVKLKKDLWPGTFLTGDTVVLVSKEVGGVGLFETLDTSRKMYIGDNDNYTREGLWYGRILKLSH